MTKDKAEELLIMLERWIDEKISNARRDPGESSCGGTYNERGYRDDLLKFLTGEISEAP